MEYHQKVTLAFASTFLLIGIIAHFSCKPDTTYANIPLTATWYETTVQLNYQNNSVDTVNIDVYENLGQINLKDGNFGYWKSTHQTGGAVSGWTPLASYVRSYKILKSKVVTKTE